MSWKLKVQQETSNEVVDVWSTADKLPTLHASLASKGMTKEWTIQNDATSLKQKSRPEERNELIDDEFNNKRAP